MTALGLNNYGKQVYRYGLETTDTDEKGEEVFRESDSTFFCRIRDLFPAELKAMYNTLESKNAWHAESFINKADKWQSEFPEELWRVDIERKYLRTYNESFINGEGDAQFLKNMANGKMKYHRRQWERSQEKYMASRYQSSAASSDNAVFRCSVPDGNLVVKPNYRLKLTPYAYMYLNVKYGTQSPIQIKAEPNKVYEIPFDGEKADIIDVYSASLIQDFGDLSSCYIATADTAKASKVKELNFGSDIEGYDNPNFTTLTTGSNYLLEKLNIENVSGLTQSLDLSELHNLRELYAHGSGIGGVEFADSGRIEIAELPAIGALTMKNLSYLTDLDIISLEKLTSLTVEACDSIDVKTIIDAAPYLNRIRITGIDWTLPDTSLLERIYNMAGFDKDGHNLERAVLAGKVYVPNIKERKLYEYNQAWSDLLITYDAMTPQFAVTFVDGNGEVVEVQYVDRGTDAEDPATRDNNPIIPPKNSTVEHSFDFTGWDTSLTNIRENKTIHAVYTPVLRRYNIRYISNVAGTYRIMQDINAEYGSYVEYTGETPSYTDGESEGYYYLFNGWDKSGYVNGNKDIYAEFDMFDYTSDDAFGSLSEMTPVKLYAMSRIKENIGVKDGVDLGAAFINSVVSIGDKYNLKTGIDYNYNDIESQVIVENRTGFNGASTIFDGSTGWDTGIKLFSPNRDFILAVDYEFTGGTNGDVLMECCRTVTGVDMGFKLSRASSTVSVSWGNSSNTVTSVGEREMVVLRYSAATKTLTLYSSNLAGDSVSVSELSVNSMTEFDKTLMFGAYRSPSGIYENKAIGVINWCKVWYCDLGDNAARSLAEWIHEEIPLSYYGASKYSLYEDDSRVTSLSFAADSLLGRKFAWKTTGKNEGGWRDSTLRAKLNNRLYKGIPEDMRRLIKMVTVASSAGNRSNEISYSGNYIYAPAAVELGFQTTTPPYSSEGKPIELFTQVGTLIKTYPDGTPGDYWTRTPDIRYDSGYVYHVTTTGILDSFKSSTTLMGIMIMLSI